jgi:hypothetical protein
MRTKFLFSCLICICLTNAAFAQFSGIVASNNVPIKDVLVCNVTTNQCVQTDVSGSFTIAASNNDEIQFSHPNFLVFKTTVTAARLAPAIELITLKLAVQPGRAPQTPSSYWIGAKLGYNFDGFSDDDLDFIGSAKIKLNMIKHDNERADYGVIGNVSDFISKTDKEDGDKDLQKLVLSVTGLNIGMYGEWFFKPKSGSKTRSACSFFAGTGYRLNTYKYVTADSITVNLSQSKTSLGFQFEGLDFFEEDPSNLNASKLNLSIEASLYLFDPKRYQKIFNEKKSTLVSVEVGAIVPIKNKIGFFVSGTFAPNVTGVFLAGLIVKP